MGEDHGVDDGMNRVLITGGAGFIGLRLAAALLAEGCEVVIFDNLCEQVHGQDTVDVPGTAVMVRGDVRSVNELSSTIATHRPDTVVHLAAETGTAESASRPAHYCDVNVVGTARLLECLMQHELPDYRLVLASTRAVYGEGAHQAPDGRVVNPPTRDDARIRAGLFDPVDERGQALVAVPTQEELAPRPISVYGSTKLMQEQLVQQLVPRDRWVILRLQNVYGPGQSLRNAYTGVLTHFCRKALAGETIPVFEDGQITRDFIYIDDVVSALLGACRRAQAAGHVINIGSGKPVTLLDVARDIARVTGLPADRVRVTGEYRGGDVRHATADITRAGRLLGWQPEVGLATGVAATVDWARTQLAWA